MLWAHASNAESPPEQHFWIVVGQERGQRYNKLPLSELKIGDLLAKLQKTGVLDSLNTAIKSTDKVSSSASTSASSSFPAHRESTPPIIPSNIEMDKFDVRKEPMTPLSNFYIPDLKM